MARLPSPTSPAEWASAMAPSSTGSPEAGWPPGEDSMTNGAYRSDPRSRPPAGHGSNSQLTSTSPIQPNPNPITSSPSARSEPSSGPAPTSSTTGSNANTSRPAVVQQ